MSKALFFKLAEDAGIEVEYTPGGRGRGAFSALRKPTPFHCMCDAPQGKKFAGLDLHCTGEIQGDDGTTKTNWLAAVKMMKDLIERGFEDCTDPDCEWCNPEAEANDE